MELIVLKILYTCLIVALTGLLFSIFMIYRNEYTYKRQREAHNLVSVYWENNLAKLSLEDHEDFFQEYIISYDKYMIHLWLWGKYSAIKKEYREMLNPYIKLYEDGGLKCQSSM